MVLSVKEGIGSVFAKRGLLRSATTLPLTKTVEGLDGVNNHGIKAFEKAS